MVTKNIVHHLEFLDMDEYLVQYSSIIVLLAVEPLTSGCVLWRCVAYIQSVKIRVTSTAEVACI